MEEKVIELEEMEDEGGEGGRRIGGGGEMKGEVD